MLRYVKDVLGYLVIGDNGGLGTVHQLLLDDETWTVRYLVLDTGAWLNRRQVLMSPIAFESVDADHQVIRARLSRDQVKGSPVYNPESDLSRHDEAHYHSYYGWPVYWGMGGRWGGELHPSLLFTAAPLNEPENPRRIPEDEFRLMSSRELKEYRVFASDGELGNITDLVVNDDTWEVRYAVVDACGLRPGKHVLVSPHWITFVSAAERMLVVNAPLDTVRKSPVYVKSQPVTRDYEVELFTHYGDQEDIERVRVAPGAIVQQ